MHRWATTTVWQTFRAAQKLDEDGAVVGAGVACRWCFQDVDRPLFIASAATCLASMATWMRIHSKLVDMSQASWFMQNYRLGGSILSVGVIMLWITSQRSSLLRGATGMRERLNKKKQVQQKWKWSESGHCSQPQLGTLSESIKLLRYYVLWSSWSFTSLHRAKLSNHCSSMYQVPTTLPFMQHLGLTSNPKLKVVCCNPCKLTYIHTVALSDI